MTSSDNWQRRNDRGVRCPPGYDDIGPCVEGGLYLLDTGKRDYVGAIFNG